MANDKYSNIDRMSSIPEGKDQKESSSLKGGMAKEGADMKATNTQTEYVATHKGFGPTGGTNR